MDTSDPDICFDMVQVCNHCDRYEQKIKYELHEDEEGQEILQKLIEKIKLRGRNKKYDCLIGVSGGLDSTMTAYLVKKELGLRPLAVHIDNGWDSELAVRNIEKTVKKLNIDLYTHVLDWELFKNLQLSFLRASVINAEIPSDHAINAGLFAIAAKNRITHIIGGSNIVTESVLPYSWVHDYKDWRLIKGIHKQFGSKKLKGFHNFGIARTAYNIFVKKIKYIPILNYFRYVKSKAIELLKEELGYKYYGLKHYESIYTRFYQAYILPKKFGVDKRRAHFSTLIRSGQMTREEALSELKKPPYPADLLEEEKEYVVKKLCLTNEEFEKIMALPIRSFHDYPNSYFWFTRFAFLLRLSKKIVTSNRRRRARYITIPEG
jgi:N-acetyl sugar amidotransferase